MPLLSLYENFLHKRYAFPSVADEVHRVVVGGGAEVFVKRFRWGGASRRNCAVFLAPGLGSDSHNFDCPAPYGLGRRFALAGYDTWAIDLRGTGLSAGPSETWPTLSFDDWLADLPAVFAHILARSGGDQLHFVGQSCGGMLGYAALAVGLGPRLRSLTTLGSPVGFPQGWAASPLIGRFQHVLAYLPGLYFRRPLQWLVPFAFGPRDTTARRYAELDNVDIDFARRLLFNAAQSLPRALAAQFRDWIDNDMFRSVDRRTDYRAAMAGASVPSLVVAAPKDQLGVPKSVRRACDLLNDVTYIELSLANGFAADYGHTDIVFGHHSPKEVVPKILDFVEQHDGESNLRVVSIDGR